MGGKLKAMKDSTVGEYLAKNGVPTPVQMQWPQGRSKKLIEFFAVEKNVEFLFRSEDLPVMRPKPPISIIWIVLSAGIFPAGNTLTAKRERPRLFGIKVQLVKDLGCLEARGFLS